MRKEYNILVEHWEYITAIEPQSDYTLIVTFENGEKRIYDCKPLLDEGVFKVLNNLELFMQAYFDGTTVAWNDMLDIAPEELYYNGIPIE